MLNWHEDLALLELADGLKLVLWVYPITFLKPCALCSREVGLALYHQAK